MNYLSFRLSMRRRMGEPRKPKVCRSRVSKPSRNSGVVRDRSLNLLRQNSPHTLTCTHKFACNTGVEWEKSDIRPLLPSLSLCHFLFLCMPLSFTFSFSLYISLSFSPFISLRLYFSFNLSLFLDDGTLCCSGVFCVFFLHCIRHSLFHPASCTHSHIELKTKGNLIPALSLPYFERGRTVCYLHRKKKVQALPSVLRDLVFSQ